MKTLLIGQAPGPNTDPEYPLYPVPRTSAGGRLCTLLGMTKGEYLRTFDRCNLLPYFPGRSRIRDDSFPMPAARLAARVMRPLLRGRHVVLVGRKVASAFDLQEADWFSPVQLRCGPRHAVTDCPGVATAMVVPHPSGRNHWYNSDDNREAARVALRAFAEKVDVGSRNVLPFVPEGPREVVMET